MSKPVFQDAIERIAAEVQHLLDNETHTAAFETELVLDARYRALAIVQGSLVKDLIETNKPPR